MSVLEARGIELAWESRGEGAEVVFVHESGVTGAVWRSAAAAVEAQGGRAIVYDRRGWGASGAPDGYKRTTVEEQSEDLAALIGAACSNSAPVVVVGAGLGALIALDLLLRRPQDLAGVVLVEPDLPGLVPEATEALSADREAIAEEVHEGGAGAVVELYLSGRLAALGLGAERIPAELTEAGRERPGSLIAELGAPAGWAMPLHRLGGAERPVVLLDAPDSPRLLREAADALADRLPAARRQQVPGEGPPHLGAGRAVAGAALALHGEGA